MPARHRFRGGVPEGEGAQRGHALTVAKWQSPFTETVRSWYAVVEITANAEADSEDSPPERIIDPPLISFYVEGDAEDLTAEQARDLAAFLSVARRGAAKTLEEIQAVCPLRSTRCPGVTNAGASSCLVLSVVNVGNGPSGAPVEVRSPGPAGVSLS